MLERAFDARGDVRGFAHHTDRGSPVRFTMPPSRHRFTFRVTRRILVFRFSIGLVVDSVRSRARGNYHVFQGERLLEPFTERANGVLCSSVK